MATTPNSLKEVQEFRYALENPKKSFERIKNEGKSIIGYFTDLVPVELIHATGCHASRIFPSRESDNPLDSLVQIFACSYLRNFLSQMYEYNTNEILSAVLFTENFCDSLQNVSDIFQHAFPNIPALFLRQPVFTDNKNVLPFFLAELKNLVRKLGDFSGNYPDENSIRASMEIYTKVRELLLEIQNIYVANPSQFSFSDFMSCVAGKELFVIEEYQKMLKNVVEQWTSSQGSGSTNLPRIIVVGGMFHDLKVFDAIEGAGSLIVGEMLSFGQNDYKIRFNNTKNVLEELGRSYLSKIPSATRLDLLRKKSVLMELVNERKADGVIHLNWQFCDPDAFERVMIKQVLDKENIPFLMIETDPLLSNLEQMKTRFQAFVELLTRLK